MKKLICAAIAAGSMIAFGDEPITSAPVAVPVQAEAKPAKAKRPMSEKAAEAKARMAKRRAEFEAKTLEILKKYIADEEQAKACLKELGELSGPARKLGSARKQKPQAESKSCGECCAEKPEAK